MQIEIGLWFTSNNYAEKIILARDTWPREKKTEWFVGTVVSGGELHTEWCSTAEIIMRNPAPVPITDPAELATLELRYADDIAREKAWAANITARNGIIV